MNDSLLSTEMSTVMVKSRFVELEMDPRSAFGGNTTESIFLRLEMLVEFRNESVFIALAMKERQFEFSISKRALSVLLQSMLEPEPNRIFAPRSKVSRR